MGDLHGWRFLRLLRGPEGAGSSLSLVEGKRKKVVEGLDERRDHSLPVPAP